MANPQDHIALQSSDNPEDGYPDRGGPYDRNDGMVKIEEEKQVKFDLEEQRSMNSPTR